MRNAIDPPLENGNICRKVIPLKVRTQSFARKNRKALRAIHIELYREELKARDKFFLRFPSWTRRQLRNVIGRSAIPGDALIDRWIRSGKILRVRHHGSELFPAFQLREGRRLPIFKRLLRAMQNDRSDWEIAHWIVSNNGWLPDCSSPLDSIESNTEDVLDAARQEILINYG